MVSGLIVRSLKFQTFKEKLIADTKMLGFVCWFVLLFRAPPAACRRFQGRGQIGAAAASLRSLRDKPPWLFFLFLFFGS